uniref:Uncharacterized protein n=1 Tax=Tetradesmus obliquus TaxID=3088 RepID=A0A383VPI6_TETOB
MHKIGGRRAGTISSGCRKDRISSKAQHRLQQQQYQQQQPQQQPQRKLDLGGADTCSTGPPSLESSNSSSSSSSSFSGWNLDLGGADTCSTAPPSMCSSSSSGGPPSVCDCSSTSSNSSSSSYDIWRMPPAALDLPPLQGTCRRMCKFVAS